MVGKPESNRHLRVAHGAGAVPALSRSWSSCASRSLPGSADSPPPPRRVGWVQGPRPAHSRAVRRDLNPHAPKGTGWPRRRVCRFATVCTSLCARGESNPQHPPSEDGASASWATSTCRDSFPGGRRAPDALDPTSCPPVPHGLKVAGWCAGAGLCGHRQSGRPCPSGLSRGLAFPYASGPVRLLHHRADARSRTGHLRLTRSVLSLMSYVGMPGTVGGVIPALAAPRATGAAPGCAGSRVARPWSGRLPALARSPGRAASASSRRPESNRLVDRLQDGRAPACASAGGSGGAARQCASAFLRSPPRRSDRLMRVLGGIRTRTGDALNVVPLPVGLRGQVRGRPAAEGSGIFPRPRCPRPAV